MSQLREKRAVQDIREFGAGGAVCKWLILGPIGIETGEAFEREYLYERGKILEPDYLEPIGGESGVEPFPGQTCPNGNLGPAVLSWEYFEGPGMSLTGPSGPTLYATVQRNVIWYAATYITARERTPALVTPHYSGGRIWVNGELVLDQPYGMAKGLRGGLGSAAVNLEPGVNRILVKVRPGYIADGVNFFFGPMELFPSLGRVGDILLFRPEGQRFHMVKDGRTGRLVNVTAYNAGAAGAAVQLQLEAGGESDTASVELEPGGSGALRFAAPGPGRERARLLGPDGGELAAFDLEPWDAEVVDGEVHVGTEFHFDTTYHEEQRVYAMGAFDICRQYVRRLREDPDFKAVISEIDYLKPYIDVFPEDREELFAAFSLGRAESDVMYNQPNAVHASEEGFVRNILYGQLFHGNVMGRVCHVYSPGDVFGHPNQMPQILRKSGCTACAWNKHIFGFPPLFRHLALDGEPLLTRRGRVTASDAVRLGIGVWQGDIDLTPPTDWTRSLAPKVVQSAPSDFMAAVEGREQSRNPLPLTGRDMSLYHAGTALSRTNLKIGNRLAENRLIEAEAFGCFAALLGARYPEKSIDKAWRQLLCGQHHDSITGTHNEISYVDLMIGYREALELAREARDAALDFIASQVRTEGPGVPVLIFNSRPRKRTDCCTATLRFPEMISGFDLVDAEGRNIPYQIIWANVMEGHIDEARVAFIAESIPAMGYKLFRAVPNQKPLELINPEPGASIESEFYALRVDPARGGGIVHLRDKRDDREIVNPGEYLGNTLAVLQEVPDRCEEQHEFYTTGLKMLSTEFEADCSVIRGPVFERLIVRYDMGAVAPVEQVITLWRGLERIEFTTRIGDYRREDDLFTVLFPINSEGTLPVFDERFGAVVRRPSRGVLDFRTHQSFMFSGCGVYPANRWLDLGPSTRVKTESGDVALGMTGLVVPDTGRFQSLAEPLMKALVRRGIPVTPWSAAGGEPFGTIPPHMDDDLLYTDFRISLGHDEDANAYTHKLLRRMKKKLRKEFEDVVAKKGAAMILVEDAELPDQRRLPVLMVQARDRDALAGAVGKLAEELERNDELVVRKSAMKGRVAPHGAALINEGTPAMSVEQGQILNCMLFHTCRWYGHTQLFPEGRFVPEQKTHVFRYALVPHAGTWKQVGLTRQGFDYNHPLIPRCADNHDGKLHSVHSFLEVEGDNVEVTAIKPAGNRYAGLAASDAADPGRGIVVRLYETTGRPASGRITMPYKILGVEEADLLERPGASLGKDQKRFDFKAGPFEIKSFIIKPLTPARVGDPVELATGCEPVQPVFVRSWEHDAGTLPMGYGELTVSISRDVREDPASGALGLKVWAVNDCVDRHVSGRARIKVPAGWSAEPESVEFSITPKGHRGFDVAVTRPSPAAAGIVKVRFEHNGQLFQDVLEIGGLFDPDFELLLEGDKVIARLGNPTDQTLEGEVALASPIETWPEADVGDYSLMKLKPRTRGFKLRSGEKADLEFSLTESRVYTGLERSFWIVGKLMCNGRLRFARVGRKGRDRVWTAMAYWEEVRAGRARMQ